MRGTRFDSIQEKLIKQDFLSEIQLQNKSGYDHSFLLNEEDQEGKKVVLTLTASDRSLQLKVSTNKPTIFVYTGNFLQGTPERGKEIYENNAGIALETQYLPGSPNNLQWPQHSSFLQPAQSYQSITRYCFVIL